MADSQIRALCLWCYRNERCDLAAGNGQHFSIPVGATIVLSITAGLVAGVINYMTIHASKNTLEVELIA